jgi:hypothetical protein
MRNRTPSPATVISLIALVLSMAGTAAAAKVLITSSSQIKDGAVTGKDVKDATLTAPDVKANAIDGTKVKNGSLGLEDLEGPARAALQASETQALEAFRKDGPSGQEKAKTARVATLANIPPGTYAIFAKTIITPDAPDSGFFGQGATVNGHCVLDAGGDKDDARAFLGSPGGISPGNLNAQITRSFGSTGSASFDCDVNISKWKASDTTIIAIRVGKAPRSPVEG